MKDLALLSLLTVACSLAGCGAWSKLFPNGDDVDAGTATSPITTGDAAVMPIAVTDAAVVASAPAVSLFEPPAPSATVETPLIKAVASTLSSALSARDFATASAQLTAETRAAYLTMFTTATATQLDKLAAALLQLEVSTLVRASVNRGDLRAEAQVALDGRTFHVGWVKTGNQWLIETL